MTLRCLIVDDEPVARQGLREYIRETTFLHYDSEASNATDAEQVLRANKIDLVLLDIQMPGKTGLQFLRELSIKPLAIITTAYPEYALEGFELDVMDYLVKPISYERFLKGVTKARDFLVMQQNPVGGKSEPYMFVKTNGRFERLLFQDILFVEGMQNYVMIHTSSQKWVVYMTMTAMENQLPQHDFMRVHKSYIVGFRHVQRLQGHTLEIDKTQIPISRSLLEPVRMRLLDGNLAKR
jgi:DNA-binding LytR/AlgR family response regulator